MQPTDRRTRRAGAVSRFNPHRLLGVGATWGAWGQLGVRHRSFNPHRLLGVGATKQRAHLANAVKFQSSPTPGSRCNAWDDGGAHGGVSVSILTDSWESVQPRDCRARQFSGWFQSSPTPGSRCNKSMPCPPIAHMIVSILTDSWESVQRYISTSCRRDSSFNPHRLLGVGATVAASRRAVVSSRFNPHRLLGVGATYYILRGGAVYEVFQSSPTPGSRCNAGLSGQAA